MQKAHYTPIVEGAIASRASNAEGVETAAVTEGWKVVSSDESAIVGHLFLTRVASSAIGTGTGAGAGGEQTKEDNTEVDNSGQEKPAEPVGTPEGLVPEVFRMVIRTVQALNTRSTLYGSEQIRTYPFTSSEFCRLNYAICANPSRLALLIESTHVWVEPAHRGRGIGSALIDFTKKKCKAAGNLPLYAQSEPQLQPFLMEPKNNFGFVNDGYYDMELAEFASAYTGFGRFRLYSLTWDPNTTA